MTECISFIVGILLGGCIGVAVLCCLQINRLYNNNSNRTEVKTDEKKNR